MYVHSSVSVCTSPACNNPRVAQQHVIYRSTPVIYTSMMIGLSRINLDTNLKLCCGDRRSDTVRFSAELPATLAAAFVAVVTVVALLALRLCSSVLACFCCCCCCDDR
jgi:hypothetical protein